MFFRVVGFDIDRTPQVGGWLCKTYFRVRTGRQFTDERSRSEGHGRFVLTAMAKSLLAARKHAAFLARGEKLLRQQNGWPR